MLTDRMLSLLNDQIHAELYSGYLYLGLANDFQRIGLDGFAHWLRLQWKEEEKHACKIIDYILGHENGEIQLKKIEPKDVKWDCACEAFKAVYDHEQKITERVENVLKNARSSGDFATEDLMLWFVHEQMEEEATARGIFQKLDMIGEDKNGLIWMDQKLGARKWHENPDHEY